MADIPLPKFMQIVADLHVKVWSDPNLKKRFHHEPEAVLKEFGLDPEAAKVVLKYPDYSVETAPPDSAVRLWNEGKKKGVIEFYFCEDPPESAPNIELSDAELMSVAGGFNLKCCSCSCCPGSTAQ